MLVFWKCNLESNCLGKKEIRVGLNKMFKCKYDHDCMSKIKYVADAPSLTLVEKIIDLLEDEPIDEACSAILIASYKLQMKSLKQWHKEQHNE